MQAPIVLKRIILVEESVLEEICYFSIVFQNVLICVLEVYAYICLHGQKFIF